MEQVYIETQDLSVGYHGKPLLKDITLKVRKGEILVLIGPNGAGKSTILKKYYPGNAADIRWYLY